MAATNPIIEIRGVKLVGAWKWNTNDEACGICQVPYDAPCPKCTVSGDQCPISKGHCGHHFHTHCINTWMEKNPTCPLDRQEWVESDI
eukprot:gnl/Chilomastix_caulleri/5371.p1 GENE.gnl/Chilomastix_caulleri/5371~~gnl/Chilomastix_caulleri/5371.p1  ORF type:complete len:95 (+),score=2.13 gnl/Chilomastix_caulleri/5371:23-286(+)